MEFFTEAINQQKNLVHALYLAIMEINKQY